jgi:hypothetical protein
MSLNALEVHRKRFAAVLATIVLGSGGAFAYGTYVAPAADDCCAPGAACCHPGSPCCLRHHAARR